MGTTADIYLRYYAAKPGMRRHHFLEIEFCADGLLRYAYLSSSATAAAAEAVVRRSSYVPSSALRRLQSLVAASNLFDAADPITTPPDDVDNAGRHELEFAVGGDVVAVSAPLAARIDDDVFEDDEVVRRRLDLGSFNSLAHDVKELFFSLVGLEDFKKF